MSLKNYKIIGDNISYETYHRQESKRGDKDFSMSRSELVSLALCPEKWIDGVPADDDSTAATEWGSLLDCLMTSPARFEELFAVCPETYTNKKGETVAWRNDRRIAEVADFMETAKGKTIIKADVRKEADTAVNALRSDDTIAELFKHSRKQVMVIGTWHDEETDLKIPVRGLLDLVPIKTHEKFGKWLVDFKTARNGNPAIWTRVCDDSGYDVQAALHRDLYVGATNEDRTDFVHVVQENTPPYHVVSPLPSFTEEFIAYGRAKYERALKLYAQCLKTGDWPSYSTGDRMVIFGLQKIAPDTLWTYRQTAGQGSLTQRDAYKPEPVNVNEITP